MDWAGSISALDGRRSTSIYIFILANGPISWLLKRQTTVALSLYKAEYIGKCNGAKEAVWLHLLLKEIGFAVNGPTTIHIDNQSAIALTSNPEYHARTKHIDIQYYYIYLKVANNTIKFKYIPTANMAADGLTKPLQRLKHAKFVNMLNMKR